LEEVLREVYGGKVYRHRHNVQGGRGSRGGFRGAKGVVIG